MKRTMILAGLLAAALTLAAQNLSYAPDPNWLAPAEARARANPLAETPAIVGGGRKLFQRHCAQCHAADGSGLKQAADLQLAVVQQQPDGALFWKITNGNLRRGMPSFSQLPEAQRWQLVLYVRSLVAPRAAVGRRSSVFGQDPRETAGER